MFREIEKDLIHWKDHVNRKPLLIRGARQVGKSYIVEKFGREHFKQLVVINFELEPRLIACFENIQPSKIIRSLEALTQQDITAGETLIFLDEIQQCPQAILALRYFKEKMPKLHIIGAGSFLELVINGDQYREPVGRVQSLYMKPCSFPEYLFACNDHRLIEYLAQVELNSGIEEPIHQLLLDKCREYFVIGGMPEAISYYTQTNKFHGIEQIHASILEYYRRDFSKYGAKLNARTLEKIFIRTPGLIAQRFKYKDIDPDIQARDQKPSLEALIKANIINPVYHSSASGLPFQVGMNEKKFKLLFLDLGLAKHATGLDIETLLHEHLIMLNQGAYAEQFVGQELLAYAKNYQEANLFYWEREKHGSQAEVDYVINIGPKIFPIEVKAGKTGRLKSLQVFLDEKGLDLGIRISQHQFSLQRRVLSIPLYMIHELERLITSLE